MSGGTLRYAGRGDVDHLDTACANYTSTLALQRAYTRQLVTYPATREIGTAGRIVADMAASVPTLSNGGVDHGATVYRFTLRDGVLWDTAPPRPVTAHDVVRGIKRMCNPIAPAPLLSYFTGSIRGLRDFAEGFRACPPTVAGIAGYLENDVEGVRALDERTVVFTLDQPTPDFLNILTLPSASAVPREYLDHLPASPELEQRIISNGPYRFARYEPGAGLRMERNPAWRPDGDDVRGRHVDRIEVIEGLSRDEATARVLSGAADLLWDLSPSAELIAELDGDPRLEAVAHGMLNPCLVFNLVSPNSGAATGRPAVRRAIRAALDKHRIAEIYGGAPINEVTGRLLPPWGAVAAPGGPGGADDPDATADPGRARALLAGAGYPDGLSLTMLHREGGSHPAVARAVRDSLAQAGIEVRLRAVPPAEFYSDVLENAENARRGEWDLMAQGWLPDWQGNNARTYLQPHFYSAGLNRDDPTWGVVYGYYRNASVNRLLEAAATASEPEHAGKLCREAELRILDDVAVIPVLFQKSVTLRASRVRGFTGYPCHIGDPTHIRLDDTKDW
ncbi:ABC transporter substrate-binding protein [Actinomadura sp. 9N215]|uniref:ABC transporter substrate-binding protein n=1 Tax=Actinomadura sp. 9N215 TaxID=3375150 RepID=UPI0037B9919D